MPFLDLTDKLKLNKPPVTSQVPIGGELGFSQNNHKLIMYKMLIYLTDEKDIREIASSYGMFF